LNKLIFIAALAVIIFCLPLWSQSITVASPHGGEVWFIGHQYTITWDSAGNMNDWVFIMLKRFEVPYFVPVLAITGHTPNHIGHNSFNWTIPEIPPMSTATDPPDTYYIEVSTSYSAAWGRSNSFRIKHLIPSSSFSVKSTLSVGEPPSPSPTITVATPNGGESWKVGNKKTISWQTHYWPRPGRVRITLYQNGNLKGTIAENILSNQSFLWTVGMLKQGNSVTGSGFKVRVMKWPIDDNAPASSIIQDLSDAPFKITNN